MQKITDLNSVTAVGPSDMFIYMFSSSHCPSISLKALYIPILLTPEVKCQPFYTMLPFKFILLSFFLVSCGECNSHSKCLLRQYIPWAQGSTLKSLFEVQFLLLLSVKEISKWPLWSYFSFYIIFYSWPHNRTPFRNVYLSQMEWVSLEKDAYYLQTWGANSETNDKMHFASMIFVNFSINNKSIKIK